VRPSSFVQADSSYRAMIVMLPVMTLLFRVLVIHQRVVHMTSADQKQLYLSSVCTCLIAAVLSVYFDPAGDAPQSAPSASETLPQYIVLALLVLQIIAQTVVRLMATEESIFDNVDWPWSSQLFQAPSEQFSFDELTTRLMTGSVRRAALRVLVSAIAAAKFVLLNYLAFSQIAMVIAGLASSGPTSSSGIESSSVIIGCIPLIISGALLLHNIAKFIRFLWQMCCKRAKHASPRRSDRNSLY
jgi:hypothetical protein